MDEIQAKIETVKIRLSSLGFWSIRFFLKRSPIMVWDLVYLEKIFSHLSQKAMSYRLYKHRLRMIDVTQQSNKYNLLFFYLLP
jgi:hypothetical protein